MNSGVGMEERGHPQGSRRERQKGGLKDGGGRCGDKEGATAMRKVRTATTSDDVLIAADASLFP